MDAPPAVAQFYNSNSNGVNENQQQQQQHINQTPAAASSNQNYNNNNNNNNNNYNQQQSSYHSYESNPVPRRTSTHEPTNQALEMMSHPLHSTVEELRKEIHELRHRLAVSEQDRTAAVAQAKADTYVHVVRVLKNEGVPGVERLRTQYGGDAIAATLRQGGGMMLLGGGERRNTVHVAAPSVNSDMLTKEELHTGLRKALRNL